MLDPLLSDRDVAKITGRARSTLQKDRVRGVGIPFVRIGALVRYRESDVAAWLSTLPTRRSTSEDAAAFNELLHTEELPRQHLRRRPSPETAPPTGSKSDSKPSDPRTAAYAGQPPGRSIAPGRGRQAASPPGVAAGQVQRPEHRVAMRLKNRSEVAS